MVRDLQQDTKEIFTHLGNVSKIRGTSVFVTLSQNVHCDSCNAKSACGVSETKTKEIEIANPVDTFEVNELVQIELKKGVGMNAVLWAYVFPFLLLMTVLLATSTFLPEWQSGVLALIILVPYYLVLHQMNAFFKKKLRVSIVKLS